MVIYALLFSIILPLLIVATPIIPNLKRVTTKEHNRIMKSIYARPPITDKKKEHKRIQDAWNYIYQLRSEGVLIIEENKTYHQYGGDLSSSQFRYILTQSKFDVIHLEFVQITDDIDIWSNWAEEYVCDKSVWLDYCVFQGTCKMNINFKKTLKCTNCTFHKRVSWLGCTFDSTLYALENTFMEDATFHIWADTAFFSASRFEGKTEFGGCSHYLRFDSLDLISVDSMHTRYEPAFFYQNTKFFFGKFRNLVIEDVTFTGNVSIEHMTIYTLRCKNAKVLSDGFLFLGTTIEDTIDFRNMTVKGMMDIRQLNLSGKCKILLEAMAFDEFKCKWSQIAHKIHFEHPDSIENIKTTYYALYENFRKEGARMDANECLYQLKEFERQNENIWYKWLYLNVISITCGYMLRPTQILFFAFFAIIVSSLFYFFTPGYIIRLAYIKDTTRKHLVRTSRKEIIDRLKKRELCTKGKTGELIERLLQSMSEKELFQQIKPGRPVSLKYLGVCCLYSFETFLRLSILTKDLHPYHWSKKLVSIIEAIIGWFTLALFIITFINATFV